ncbi:uncharacterized protein LOC131213627 isoform X1 [Anopheles bellator]|uniref:uncharacterized protein LOC131213627 isoform X1 n=1 Tax=Anopheles bellator TaxID=139047 RepID=UPI0026482666|nr:uncharacterized protein LOC131213627 isoform X1 [Anopheles bellator]
MTKMKPCSQSICASSEGIKNVLRKLASLLPKMHEKIKRIKEIHAKNFLQYEDLNHSNVTYSSLDIKTVLTTAIYCEESLKMIECTEAIRDIACHINPLLNDYKYIRSRYSIALDSASKESRSVTDLSAQLAELDQGIILLFSLQQEMSELMLIFNALYIYNRYSEHQANAQDLGEEIAYFSTTVSIKYNE